MMLSEKIHGLYKNSFVSDYMQTARNLSRWTYLLFMVALTFTLVVYIDNVKQIDMQLQLLEQKREQLRDLTSTNKLLHARYIELQNPERIDRIARETLGMIVPDEAPTRVAVRR
jgi:cell division protein FtsL